MSDSEKKFFGSMEMFDLIHRALNEDLIIDKDALKRLAIEINDRMIRNIYNSRYVPNGFIINGKSTNNGNARDINVPKVDLTLSNIRKILGFKQPIDLSNLIWDDKFNHEITSALEELYSNRYKFLIIWSLDKGTGRVSMTIIITAKNDSDDISETEYPADFDDEENILEEIEDYFGDMSDRQLKLLRDQISQRLSNHGVDI